LLNEARGAELYGITLGVFFNIGTVMLQDQTDLVIVLVLEGPFPGDEGPKSVPPVLVRFPKLVLEALHQFVEKGFVVPFVFQLDLGDAPGLLTVANKDVAALIAFS